MNTIIPARDNQAATTTAPHSAMSEVIGTTAPAFCPLPEEIHEPDHKYKSVFPLSISDSAPPEFPIDVLELYEGSAECWMYEDVDNSEEAWIEDTTRDLGLKPNIDYSPANKTRGTHLTPWATLLIVSEFPGSSSEFALRYMVQESSTLALSPPPPPGPEYSDDKLIELEILILALEAAPEKYAKKEKKLEVHK